jgi:hypothetical protein
MDRFRTQVASDVIRDGVGLELIDQTGAVFAEVFRCDADHTLTLEISKPDVPSTTLDDLVMEAYRRLTPFEDGTPLPPRTRLSRFYRNASGQLTFEVGAPSDSYKALRNDIVSTFKLHASEPPVVGLDARFDDLDTPEGKISLAWDNWTGFTVTAHSPATESLVRRIAQLVRSKLPE